MKSRPIFAFLKDTMYMYEVDLFVYCVIHYFLIGKIFLKNLWYITIPNKYNYFLVSLTTLLQH